MHLVQHYVQLTLHLSVGVDAATSYSALIRCWRGAWQTFSSLAQASSAKRQRSRTLLRSAQRGAAASEHGEAAQKGNGPIDASLEDDEASGAAQGRNLCINLLDDSEDEDASLPQPVSLPA